METEGLKKIAVCLVLALCVGWAWTVLNWVWLRPRKMEKWLRKQGLHGNSYRFLYGDSKQNSAMIRSALSKPISLSDDAVARASPVIHHTVEKYGKNSFMWFGPSPRVLITDPGLIKEVMTKNYTFTKPKQNNGSGSVGVVWRLICRCMVYYRSWDYMIWIFLFDICFYWGCY